MSGIEQFDDKVWDRFFDYLYCEDPKPEEVRERLTAAGIDIAPALRRVQQAIVTSQARTKLESARASRAALLEKFQGIMSPVGEQLREGLKDLIARKFAGTAQAAYFRKLEEAASEEDLQSLLDDLHRLEMLSEDD
jgi:hypothetical protein